MKLFTRFTLFTVLALLLFSSGKLFAQAEERMKHDILLLMQEKNERTPAQQKIASLLLQAIRESRGQKMVEGVNLEPAKVPIVASGNVQIDISAKITDDLLDRMEKLGARIIYPSWRFNTVRVEAPFSVIETIAAFPEVRFIEPGGSAVTVGSVSIDNTAVYSAPKISVIEPASRTTLIDIRKERLKAQLAKSVQQYKIAKNYFTGTVNSQADATHRAADVRTTYGFEGQGVRIGILSNSFNSLAGGVTADIASGNIPGAGNPLGNTTPVTVLVDASTSGSGADEGRAMLQLVHDLAPKAQLYFATANPTQAAFATNILALAGPPYNCDIIVDDVFYYAEPVFQDGIIAQAVDAVAADGVLYLSSAGNEGSVSKSSAGYFEGDFNDAGSAAFSVAGGTIHNFGTIGSPVNGNIITAIGNRYNLSWSDPVGTSSNDYDLYLVNSAGTVKAMSTTVQSGTQNPYEEIVPPTLIVGDRLVVFKKTAAQVRAFALNTVRGRLTNFTTGQTHGHSSALGALSVAATPAQTTAGGSTPNGPYPAAFNAGNKVEYFSSDGPRRMFYNANGSAITGGNFLIGTGGGAVRNKPDITAADGTATTVTGFSTFYGTSAAAPHAGAIAALLKSGNPSITLAQLRNALTSTALDIETAGYDIVSGVGIVQAFQAMQSISAAPAAMLFVNTVAITEGPSGTNSNSFIDPNENGRMLVTLNNPTPVAATAVSALLTTSTAGITITQPAAVYGTIGASGGSATNTATPFAFTVNGGVPCGTLINFTLTVNFVGGISPQSFPITAIVGTTGTTINATLGAPPPTSTEYITASGTFSTNRLTRGGQSSTCLLPKTNPGLTASSTVKPYHAYTFTNRGSASQCVQVALNVGTITGTGTAANVYTVVYTNGGFVLADASANYLADPGNSFVSNNFSFTAPAGQDFTIVFHEITPTVPASTYAYSLNISLAGCPSPTLPVSWLSFTAVPRNKQVALEWKVTNEINVSRYEVEYSTNGSSFSQLYIVPAAAGIASEKVYNQLHPFPVAGNNYYRIRQIDIDGKVSYSKIVLVKVDKGNNISLAPNPARSFVNIQAKSLISSVQLFNTMGQLVMKVNPAVATYQLQVGHLPAGNYYIRVEAGTEIINEKITKE